LEAIELTGAREKDKFADPVNGCDASHVRTFLMKFATGTTVMPEGITVTESPLPVSRKPEVYSLNALIRQDPSDGAVTIMLLTGHDSLLKQCPPV
jgi:hypothetical protein